MRVDGPLIVGAVAVLLLATVGLSWWLGKGRRRWRRRRR
jgi:hypothetical protein